MRHKFIALLIGLMLVCGFANAGKFYPDDPLAKDPDQRPAAKPAENEPHELQEFLQMSFSDPATTHEKRSQRYCFLFTGIATIPATEAPSKVRRHLSAPAFHVYQRRSNRCIVPCCSNSN